MTISISEVIAQNTVGGSDGKPAGVPAGWGFYDGVNVDGGVPPSNFTAVTGWAHVYQKAGASAYTNPNASIEVANSKTYVRLKTTGEWVQVQNQTSSTGITGGYFVTDFSGPTRDMRIGAGSGGSTAIGAPPAGYMDHFWPTARGTFSAGSVDAVYVQMDMRVTDPNLHLIAQLGADWWRDANAPFFSDFRNNPGVGTNNWTELSTQWTTMGFYSTSTAQFQANPPPLLGSGQTTPSVTGIPDKTEPAAPKIAAFTPDTGTVGEEITTASVLTLSGTAEARSTVKLFDRTTQIGTAKANASGAWSPNCRGYTQLYRQGDGRRGQHQLGIVCVKLESGCGDVAASDCAARDFPADNWREPAGERFVRGVLCRRRSMGGLQLHPRLDCVDRRDDRTVEQPQQT